jgi:hypothetical protein
MHQGDLAPGRGRAVGGEQVIAAARPALGGRVDVFPARLDPARAFQADPLIKIAFWGGVGGVVANIETVIRFGNRWNPALVPWYIARPFTAAVFSGIGYVIFVTLVLASVRGGADISELDRPATALGYVIAFTLGFREELFRELLKRVIDLLATAGGADVEPPSTPPSLTCKLDPAGSQDVFVEWQRATDNVEVTAYNVYRDGLFLATVRLVSGKEDEAEQPSFCDRNVPADSYEYSVTATDAAANESHPAGPVRIVVPEGRRGSHDG